MEKKISKYRRKIKTGLGIIKHIIKRCLGFIPYKEERKSYGSMYPDKTFYVIRLIEGGGLFCYINTFLSRVKYAIEKGYIPVIDMKNYTHTYSNKHKKRVNFWETYFEQPCGYDLNTIKRAKNVILSKPFLDPNRPRFLPESLHGFTEGMDDGSFDEWKRCATKYLRLNERIKKIIENEYNRLIEPTDKVLGVMLRGTDYIYLKPKGHCVQPSMEQALGKIKEYMLKKNFTKIFIGTEDIKIYNFIKSNFPDGMVVTNRKNWIDYKEGFLQTSIQKINKEQEVLEYLTTVMLLAKTQYLISGRFGGAVGVRMFANNLKEVYYFDLGMYEDLAIIPN
jgi:hypothetical protein